MAKEVVLTSEGYAKLQEKLDDLINNKRRECSERIKVAREFGDLSENAEYDAAKDEQAMVEAEIKEIQDQIANALIIDENVDTTTVSLGSFVKVFDILYDEKVEYQIVGTTEADISQNRISNESPLAKALLGHKKNDTVTVKAPAGNLQMKIMGIRK